LFGAREMLLGWRHPFEYGECPQCGSLQIRKIPPNLPDYYPANYVSLLPLPVRSRKVWPGRRVVANWLLQSRSAPAAWVVRHARGKYPFFHWCRMAGAGLDSQVLDVGCGNGGLLRRLQRHGFRHLAGVDPYALKEADEPGFSVRRTELEAVEGTYDLIMLHHVLEHLVDPQRSLEEARARLSRHGRILVRIPVAGSQSHRLYGADWFNLDPPRHLLVPSRHGMEALAQRSGLRAVSVEFDGVASGFLLSEHYRHGTPYADKPRDSFWHRRRCQRLAEQANRRGEGDQAVFLLAAAEDAG
jgi:SAM-dependent methyltransferase